MKKFRMRNLLLVSAFAFGAIGTGITVSAQNSRDQVSGQGSLPAVNQDGKEMKRQFSVSAQRQAGGTVKGNAVLHNPSYTTANGQKYQLQVDISCMKVDGNTVFLGGTTKRTNDQSLVDTVYFSVQDNGEPGKNKDMISRAYFFDGDPTTTGDPQLCQNNKMGDFAMETIESGNINVKTSN